jgi:hypothetical protein
VSDRVRGGGRTGRRQGSKRGNKRRAGSVSDRSETRPNAVHLTPCHSGRLESTVTLPARTPVADAPGSTSVTPLLSLLNLAWVRNELCRRKPLAPLILGKIVPATPRTPPLGQERTATSPPPLDLSDDQAGFRNRGAPHGGKMPGRPTITPFLHSHTKRRHRINPAPQ